jgi:hemerythrin-like domain-containing protein
MCEYCGCREVEPIGELMDEHSALMAEGHELRRALEQGAEPLMRSWLGVLIEHLGRHVRREEAGVFRALQDKGEFLDELAELEAEHRQFDQTMSSLQVGEPDFAEHLIRLLDNLEEHVEREDLGIFPVSVVTLGGPGWRTVERARVESPSFLLDPDTPDLEADHVAGLG